jgi:type VI secretion system protein ImpG
MTKDDVMLWPIAVKEAAYHTSNELGGLRLPANVDAKAAIRIRLETRLPGCPFKNLAGLDSLRFYLKAMARTPVSVYEQLFAHGQRALVRTGEGAQFATASNVERVGFDDSAALFPSDPRCFQGYRLLREYFTLPERFLFFQISDLAEALSKCDRTSIELIIPLRQEERSLSNALTGANFALFCAPAVNLFSEEIRADVTTGAFEFPLIPRLYPEDFEVFSVSKVVASGSPVSAPGARARAMPSSGRLIEQVFWPFYRLDDRSRGVGTYFTLRRLDRRIERAVPDDKTREQFLNLKSGSRVPLSPGGGDRNGYKGSDVFVCLVDANEAPFSPELSSLTAECLCTNRGLALTMRPGEGTTDFTLSVGAPIQSARCADGVLSRPQPSYAHGDFAWRLVNHLTVNYLSLTSSDEEKSAAALRMLLGLYSHANDPDSDPRVQAVKFLKQRSKVHRMPIPGQVTFARGLELSIGLDESAFGGTGAFLLGAVLEQFFAKYVSINSFTQTVLETAQRGQVMRWPAKIGRRAIL